MTISQFAAPGRHPRRRFGAAAGRRPAAQDKDPLIAKVNGIEIHQSDLAVAEEEAGQIPPMSPDAKKDYLVQFMADMILVSKAAEAKKMDDTPEFKRKMAFARNKLLMEELLQSVGKEALTDEAMHKVYDEAVKQMGEVQEVHARHILIRAAPGDEKASKAAEDKIKAIIARLKKGEDFAKVAERGHRGPVRQGQWRRPRLFQQGTDGAGILRGRLQAGKGPDLRAGEDPVRLARDQGRGQARQGDAEVRRGQAADRAIM